MRAHSGRTARLLIAPLRILPVIGLVAALAAWPSIVATAAVEPSGASIPWIKDDPTLAFKDARARGKPVLLYFHTTWCSWCLEYEDKVFTDEEVLAETSGFVTVRLNCDRREGQQLMKRYGVSSFPTILVANQAGDVIGRLGMYRPVPDFLRFLRESRTPGESLAALDQRIEKGERSPEMLIRSGSRHYEAGDMDTALSRYEEAIAACKSAGAAEPIADARLGLASVKSMMGDAEGALAQYRTVLKEHPGSTRLAEAFVGAIVILEEQKKSAEIDSLFRDYGDRFPNDAAVLNDHARRLLDAGGDAALALKKSARAVELSPDSGDYHATHARALLATGSPEAALHAIQRAIERRPTDRNFRVLRLEIIEANRVAASPPR